MRRTLVTALLVFFILLSVVSVLVLYYTHATPLEENLVTSPYTYAHYGTYGYIASLTPNTIYDNRTTLELEDEGSIYRRVINFVDVNFTYLFQGNLPANFTVQYKVDEYIETAMWRKRIGGLPQETINATGSSANISINSISTIYPSSIQQFVTNIEKETGILTTQPNLNINVEIHIQANTSVGTINESFTTTSTIEFRSTATGGEIITISGLENTRSDKITKITKIHHEWVGNQRIISYIISLVAFFSLTITTWVFIHTRPSKPPKPEKLLEDIIEPYREIIVEATQEPSKKEPHLKPATIVTVKTLEDLVKIADILDKPILHTHKPPETHIFRIFDDAAQYEFTTTISNIAKRKAIIEEEES